MENMQHTAEQTPAVIVIGGGPAGASAATVLARKGHSVLLLEKLRFPRFHIGESLLPFMAGQLERMGLLGKIEQGNFVRKFGTEFTGEDGRFHRVDFTSQGAGRRLSTFQVERAIFDNILLEQAKEAGVHVLEEATVVQLLVEGEAIVGVKYVYQGETREVRAPYVIDGSGRAGKVASLFRLRKYNKRLRNVAVFTHFENLNEANNPGWPGDTMLGFHKDGWVWAIPIHEDVISIGTLTPYEVIKQASSIEEVFETHYPRVPRIVQRLRGATPGAPVQAETDYCYHCEKLAGPGYIIVGDAGCFVDPIFSAGVYLSVICGIRAAETLDSIYRGQAEAGEALARYERFAKTGYDCNFRLAYSFYDYDHNFAKFIWSNRDKFEERHISRAIGGDFWNPYNTITRYLRTERRWDTFEEPFEFAYGCPVYPELEAREAMEGRWFAPPESEMVVPTAQPAHS